MTDAFRKIRAIRSRRRPRVTPDLVENIAMRLEVFAALIRADDADAQLAQDHARRIIEAVLALTK